MQIKSRIKAQSYAEGLIWYCRMYQLIIPPDNLIGEAEVSEYNGELMWSLDHLRIVRKYRGRGYGTKLLGRIIKDANKCGIEKIWVHAVPLEQRNPNKLIKLYKSSGFKVIEYPGDEPYPLMEREILGA